MNQDIIARLREWEETMLDAIKRLDMGEMDNGIMTSIRFEQHDTLKRAADRIETLEAVVDELYHALDTMVVATTSNEKEQFEGHHKMYLETVAKPRALNALDAVKSKR